MGERTYGPLPRAKFHVYRGRNVGIQPPKLFKKNSNFGQKFVLQGRLVCNIFYEILSICMRLVWSLSRDKDPSYKHFSAVGAFCQKFSMAPSGETTDRIKKKLGGGVQK